VIRDCGEWGDRQVDRHPRARLVQKRNGELGICENELQKPGDLGQQEAVDAGADAVLRGVPRR